jgi:hypothetical protein
MATVLLHIGHVGVTPALAASPYLHGDLEADGALARTVARVSRPADSGCAPSSSCSLQRELVLLHANHKRMRLLVNVAAQLSALGMHHTLALGFSETLCTALQKTTQPLHCAFSSYLRRGPLAAAAKRLLPPKHIAWLQRFYYLRRFFELGVRVLALDTDMAIVANPFIVLRDPSVFGRFQMVTTFDFKGGFANTNIGFVCLQNATLGGPVHALFLEFEARVARALRMPAEERPNKRASFITRFVWDQNLFNKVLLSAMVGHAAYLPDGADSAWTAAHKPLLRARLYWKQPAAPIGPPRWLGASEPYFPRKPSPVSSTPWAPMRFNALWTTLTTVPPTGALAPAPLACAGAPNPTDAAAAAAAPAAAGPTKSYCGSGESVLLAPAWLVAMEQGIGHKLKHVAYGVSPSPAVIIHFTCTTQTEAARVWPLRLYGYWHAAAVAEAEAALAKLSRAADGQADKEGGRRLTDNVASIAAATTTAAASEGIRAPSLAPPAATRVPRPHRMVALVDGLMERPLPPLSWASLNAYHAVLGALAALTGRALVMPSLNCTGVTGGNIGPEKLSGRCFWHLQAPDSGGVRCVLRIGSCEDPPLATPTEASDALAAERRARGGTAGRPATLPIDLRAPVRPPDVDALVAAGQSDARILLVSLKLPSVEMAKTVIGRGGGGRRRDVHSQLILDAAAEHAAAHTELARHIKSFRRRCSDLTTRSKQGSECNNICS